MFHQYEQARQNQPLNSEHIGELYFITPISNLQSILQNGLLSNKRAKRMLPQHEDVSNRGVQNRRATTILERVLPNKNPRSIHRHAVLYLNPHNAMMANMKEQKKQVCVLRINKSILSRSDAIISDKNAAIEGACFFTRDAYKLDPDKAEALYLSHSLAPLTVKNKKEYQNIRQSEALLPYAINSSYIIGIIVGSGQDRTVVQSIVNTSNAQIPIAVVPSIFLLGRHTRIIPSLVDPAEVDYDTLIFVKKTHVVSVFWRFFDNQVSTINSRNITGPYKDQILNMINEKSWRDSSVIDQTDPRFGELLNRCGANCPLERFSLISNPPEPIAGFPDSSDDEDRGSPQSIIRRP